MSEGARRCILLYRESVDDARTFLSAARTRPVILIKGGQGASRAEAACSSTGALAADALERAGGELAALPPATLAAIDKMESPNGSHRNPTLGRDPLPKTAPSSSRCEQFCQRGGSGRRDDGDGDPLAPHVDLLDGGDPAAGRRGEP